MPLVKYMEDKGNVTLYEYRTGDAPKSVEETALEFSLLDNDDEVADESKADQVKLFSLSVCLSLSLFLSPFLSLHVQSVGDQNSLLSLWP